MDWHLTRLVVVLVSLQPLIGCRSKASRGDAPGRPCSLDGPVLVELHREDTNKITGRFNELLCEDKLSRCLGAALDQSKSRSRAIVVVLDNLSSWPLAGEEGQELLAELNRRRLSPAILSREARKSAGRLGILEWQTPFENPRDLERTRFLLNGLDFGVGESAFQKWLAAAKDTACDVLLEMPSPYTSRQGFAARGEKPFDPDGHAVFFADQGVRTIRATSTLPPTLQPWRFE